ncbi:MAG: helix-turn-helix transcriptional regulator [Enterocloster asparagiformis]|nr:helix-turn-helix transcriptional regulator [Enterocloster asparagiformis]
MEERRREMRQEGFYEEFHSFYYYSGSTRSWKMKGLHIHKEYELLLFMSGGASIRIGSRMYQTRPGDLFLINNREYHKTEGAEGAAYSRYVLMFDPDWILGLEPALGYRFSRLFEDREEGGVRLHLSGGTLEQVIRQMERIEGYSRRREDEAGQVLLKLCILELLVKLDEFSRSLEAGGGDGWENCGRAGWGKVGQEAGGEVGREPGSGVGREAGSGMGREPGSSIGREPGSSIGREPGSSIGRESGGGVGREPSSSMGREPSCSMSREPGTTTRKQGTALPDRERVEQIKSYVREHIGERLDLEDIARQFYISSHYLSHYFRRETGFTLGQFIAQAKIDRAKELLQKGFSVTDTAISLSYNSDSHFINTFKRLTGTTPKRYASEMRK